MDELILKYVTGIGGPGAVAALAWWLSGKFQEVKDNSRDLIVAHEVKDDERHEDNLRRFNAIEIELAHISGRQPSYAIQKTNGPTG